MVNVTAQVVPVLNTGSNRETSTQISPKPTKPIHTIVLDAGPLIKNSPPLSSLLAKSEYLLTTPTVLAEIRDPTARARIDTMYHSFVTTRAPKPSSLAIVTEFARKTGDLGVLSRTDLEIIALAYEVEYERNGGDWRLRKVPGQKGINGKPPQKDNGTVVPETIESRGTQSKIEQMEDGLKNVKLDREESPEKSKETNGREEASNTEIQQPVEENNDSDGSDGWITPSNIKKHKDRDEDTDVEHGQTMQVATISFDYAMQNVLMQINLNVLSTGSLQRIKQVKSYLLRCHACFYIVRDMSKQFCPRCGMATLTRVSCSTTANGKFQIHLKKNMEWHHRGDRYSIPKPSTGSTNGRPRGGPTGGKGGWGSQLILSEDQKEYVRAMTDKGKQTKKAYNLMDEDYLPGILTGERNQRHGRIRVGASRDVNSRKRR